ncbi:MAG: hypothetical protein ABSA26_13765 [Thermoguttaceae bacterium]|jgi:hypothetical protein
MDHKVIRKLEKKIEKAIAEVIVVHRGLKRLLLPPCQQTMEMMASGGGSLRGGG